MKKLLKNCLFAAIASLAIGLSTLAVNATHNVKEADATSSKPISGTFSRITDLGQLGVGTKVIFVSTNGDAMDDVWGNPGYVHGGQTGVSVSNDLNHVTLTNSHATIFTVEEGTETAMFGDVLMPSFAFRADSMNICGQKKSNIYFAHNEKEYYGDSTFENIGYFKDHDSAVEVKKIKESSWFIEFSDEEDYEEIVRVTHLRNAKSVKAGDYTSEVNFTYRYAPRFCSNGDVNINIYQLDDGTLHSVSVYQNPTKTNYTQGQAIDLSGLIIDVHTPSDSTRVYYDESYEDFSYPAFAYGSGEVLFEISYTGIKLAITLNVSKPSYSVTKVGQLADYRGTFMLVDNEGGYGCDTVGKGDNPLGFHRVLNGTSNDVFSTSYSYYDDMRITITQDNLGYHLKNPENKFIDLDSGVLTNSSTTVVIEHTNSGERVRSTSGKYLYFDELEYEYGVANQATIDANNNYKYITLYKYPLSSEEQTALDGFVSTFKSTTDVCDSTGATFSITEEDWNTLSGAFSALTGPVQAEIINTTYIHILDESGFSNLEFAMSRYDYIYTKYHSLPGYTYITDFIGRSEAGTMPSANAGTFREITNNADADMNAIVIVSITTVTVLVSFIFLKKRKDNATK